MAGAQWLGNNWAEKKNIKVVDPWLMEVTGPKNQGWVEHIEDIKRWLDMWYYGSDADFNLLEIKR
jgi:hypothetical protein